MKKITMTALSVAVTVIFLGAAKAAPVKDTRVLENAFSPLPAAWLDNRDAPQLNTDLIKIAKPLPTRFSSTAGQPLVLGWLPYWKVGAVTLHLDQLTHLAYFGVKIEAGGALVDSRHWTDGRLDQIIAQAHEAGVDVVLTAICFDSEVMNEILSSAVMRTKVVTALVDMAVDHGGQGVNVDFEGLPLARKQDFVDFIIELKATLNARIGDRSHVSIATPAVDWRGAFAYKALATAADALVIMGYDYHYSGGPPGPVAPLAPSTRWGKYSLEWTVDDYEKFAGSDLLHKVALALPLYGRSWPVVDSQVPGVRAEGTVSSPSFADCQTKAKTYGWRFDEPSFTPWYYIAGATKNTQTWCEHRASLTKKMELAHDRGLAGIGFWALGYEADLDDPWLALQDAWRQVEPSEPDTPDVVEDASQEDAIEPEVIDPEVLDPDADDLQTVPDDQSGASETSNPTEDDTSVDPKNDTVSADLTPDTNGDQPPPRNDSYPTDTSYQTDVPVRTCPPCNSGCSSGSSSSPIALLILFTVLAATRRKRA